MNNQLVVVIAREETELRWSSGTRAVNVPTGRVLHFPVNVAVRGVDLRFEYLAHMEDSDPDRSEAKGFETFAEAQAVVNRYREEPMEDVEARRWDYITADWTDLEYRHRKSGSGFRGESFGSDQ